MIKQVRIGVLELAELYVFFRETRYKYSHVCLENLNHASQHLSISRKEVRMKVFQQIVTTSGNRKL